MKIQRMLEYLKTLAKMKRNFFGELADEAKSEIDKARLQGMADAHAEQTNELEQISAAMIETPDQMPQQTESAPIGVTLQ
jgi:hypothetical protein